MQWNNFKTYNDSHERAFETFCTQLFERFLKRIYKSELVKFRVLKGSGGDGGIESYGQFKDNSIIALQAKWFITSMDEEKIGQIRKSITTALSLRPTIKEYIICVPHNISSLKFGRGKKGEKKKPIVKSEENRIEAFEAELKRIFPALKVSWWYDKDIQTELEHSDNEGVHKYWFDKEIISGSYLLKQFELQKKSWLNERYIAELHGQGIIHKEYNEVTFSKQFRESLIIQIEKLEIDLKNCIKTIEEFKATNPSTNPINIELNSIVSNIKAYIEEFQTFSIALRSGNDFYTIKKLNKINFFNIKQRLYHSPPTNLQKNVRSKLISVFDKVEGYDLSQFTESMNSHLRQTVCLFLGEAGTGKTHGFANCVELHLQNNSPAIIIRAKGCPYKNWTEILSHVTELREWRKEEIFSALESTAIRNDCYLSNGLKDGEELFRENSKVLICIDGLDEVMEFQSDWYERIRECEKFVQDYPRIRFLFSARPYFYNEHELISSGYIKKLFLPKEGDVPVLEISKIYFDFYNIKIHSSSIIKKIDSLLALRLFCEHYKNATINESDIILTATRELLNQKINKLNEEFIQTLNKKIGKSRFPITEALTSLADFFYFQTQADHNQIVEVISKNPLKYLDANDIDLLVDYLADNGILIKWETIEKVSAIQTKRIMYSIAYQSMIDYIIAENIFLEIRNGKINKMPDSLITKKVQPYSSSLDDEYFGESPWSIQSITQSIVTRLFFDTGNLIGVDGYLTQGFSKEEILIMQLTALRAVPSSIGLNFKSLVDQAFFGGFLSQYLVLKNLILPSSKSKDNCFGAEYLHNILIHQPSVFERDRLWSGLDNYEKRKFNAFQTTLYSFNNITSLFKDLEDGEFYLYEISSYNETPLVFAWGLSSIDQALRFNLRVALTKWAIKNPSEYLLLLKKLFFCNDPQIQEDLSSITLGLASRLKEKNQLKEIATWGLENIFSNLNLYRNIIVRQGFRAIIERAYQYRVISRKEVYRSRPNPFKKIILLPLDKQAIKSGGEEINPIVHDLAWYVIEKAYEEFLQLPTSSNGNRIGRDCPEAKRLLKAYTTKYKEKLYAHEWAMSAAIAYIKKLGFTRKNGNSWTEATHGSKSKIFTYEEKYTWLAVRYIQGYLSDYIPLNRWSIEDRKYVKDYFQLTDMPNPAESIIELDDFNINDGDAKIWVIKETLSDEIENKGNLNKSIEEWVNAEPKINFEKWLRFKSQEFGILKENCDWLSLYNYTCLHDSKEIALTVLNSKACLIKSSNFNALVKTLKKDLGQIHFITHLKGLTASPKTDTYSNPSDIVWMTWIEETENKETFYYKETNQEKSLYIGLTRLVRNTLKGEEEFMLPSKKIRKMLKCYDLVGTQLKNARQNTVGFYYTISDGSYKDRQEMVLVDNSLLDKAMKKENLQVVWFVDLLKQKNPLNKQLDNNFHAQKSRKYFVWIENGEFKSFKFWDERFSNAKDDEMRIRTIGKNLNKSS